MMDEIEVVYRRFGDEQSTLLDHFERLSFEVQLNQAMLLGRSLSEPREQPRAYRSQRVPLQPLNGRAPPPKMVATQEKRRRRGSGSGFNKVLKKLLKPILGKKNGDHTTKEVPDTVPMPDPKNPKSWKHLSRSLRF